MLLEFETNNFKIVLFVCSKTITTPTKPIIGALNINITITCPCNVNPLIPHIYGVYRGNPVILIIFPKHRLWVLVRIASPPVTMIYVFEQAYQKYQSLKNVVKFSFFLQLKKTLYIAWESFRDVLLYIQALRNYFSIEC